MNKKEIMKWMKENYPQYADNEELAVALYKRMVKNVSSDEDEFIDIGEIKEAGIRVRVRGVIVEKRVSRYKGCAVCKRKNCKEHKAGKKTYVFTSLLVGDNTGMIWCVYGDDTKFDVGDEIEVRGKTKIYKNNLEIMADSVNLFVDEDKEEKLKEVLEFVEKSGRVKEGVIKKMCKKNKVRFEDVIKDDRISLGDGGWIYWVGGGESG